MTAEETVYGLWYTCSLEGLASRKEELLKKVVGALELRGFKLQPTWSWLRNQILSNTPSINFALISEKTKLKMGLHFETVNTNIKFSYSYLWKEVWLEQKPTWMWILWGILVFGCGFLLVPLYIPSVPSIIEGFTNKTVDGVLTIFWLFLLLLPFIPLFRHKHAEKKISKYIAEIIQTISGTKPTFKMEFEQNTRL